MAAVKTRIVHKASNSDLPLTRHRPRLSEEPQRTATADLENPTITSPAQQRFQKPQKQKVQEALATSPYATAVQGSNIPRSSSVAKTSVKAGKQISPVKDKSATMLNFSRSDMAINRGKASSNEPRPRAAREALNLTSYPRDAPSDASFTTSFNSSALFPAMDSPRAHIPKKQQAMKSVKNVEASFLRTIKDLGEDRQREMAVYSQAFSELITLLPSCKSLLSRIKLKYEDWISQSGDSAEIEKCQREVVTLQKSLLQEMEEKNNVMRKLEKLARENAELSRSCDNFQNKCYEYEEKLYQLANAKLEGFPPTEETWKLLVSELGSYKAWKTKVVKELRITQAKEKKLLDLIRALKDRGFPVEEVYNTDVRRAVKSYRSSSQDSDDGAVSYGAPCMKPKPGIVPELKLEEVDRDIPSSSSSAHPSNDSSFRQAVSSLPAKRPAADPDSKPAKLVPKISIPEGLSKVDSGFQQEFLAKYSEFSESWRKQVDAMKH